MISSLITFWRDCEYFCRRLPYIHSNCSCCSRCNDPSRPSCRGCCAYSNRSCHCCHFRPICPICFGCYTVAVAAIVVSLSPLSPSYGMKPVQYSTVRARKLCSYDGCRQTSHRKLQPSDLLTRNFSNSVSRRSEKTSPRLLLEPSSRERRELSLYIGVNQGLDRESIARGFAGVQRSASP